MHHLKFDHAIITVFDLETAMKDFSAAGFTVFFGGEHKGGYTHNALIVFADGGYLELIAPTDPTLLLSDARKAGGNFLSIFKAGEGFAGYVFHTNDIAVEVERLRAHDLHIDQPKSGGRQRADGKQLEWQSAMFAGTTTPFYITDVTPRELRVPADTEKTTHANRVSGAAGIVVVVPDINAGAAKYQTMLQLEPMSGASIADAKTAKFIMNDFTVTLAAPDETDGPIARHLEQRGETPYLLQLRTNESASMRILDLALTHAARIEIEKG